MDRRRIQTALPNRLHRKGQHTKNTTRALKIFRRCELLVQEVNQCGMKRIVFGNQFGIVAASLARRACATRR